MQALVVTNPMRGYQVGDRITDPALIAEIRASEHAHHVVLTNHADAYHSPTAPETDEE